MNCLFPIFIFLSGLCVGSFLNVVICRLDSRESILFSRSHCPKCGKILEWYDLIPLLSFFLLKGKCRYCGKKISWQYPLVEITAASLFLITFFISYRIQVWESIYYLIAVCFLIIISAYDFKHYLIPDEVVYPAIAISLAANIARGIVNNSLLSAVQSSLFAILIGSGFFLFLFLISKGKWMGLGDAKLAVFLSLLLGWPNILLAISFSFSIGAVVGLVLIVSGKKKMNSQIPFGPFLSAGSLVVLFWGSQILNWYLGLF